MRVESMNILVIDVGGSHVKVLATGQREERKFVSGPELTAQQMVDGVKQITHDWEYDAVSIGYPGPVLEGRPTAEPVNLGKGWESFDFAAAFGKPAKVINDAAMQALGSYEGGKMLFLGLGTGLGTAMVVAGRVYPMELGHLPYRKATFEDYVGDRGLVRLGTKKWRRRVADVTATLLAGLQCEYVVLGGGNVRKLKQLPPGCRAGSNENAFTGGFRLWETAPAADRGPPPTVPDGKTASADRGSNGDPNHSEANHSEAVGAADSRPTSAK
ncbi:MAG TPA: ROK family protein [Pirellulales bacterium]|jgi:polyphosphate glucokinase|nr:ROK family protein [Pirellulales bacterium]